jgi:hypothetical protein
LNGNVFASCNVQVQLAFLINLRDVYGFHFFVCFVLLRLGDLVDGKKLRYLIRLCNSFRRIS